MDTTKLRLGELIAGVSAILLFIVMFFHWYGIKTGVSSQGSAILKGLTGQTVGSTVGVSAWSIYSYTDLLLLLLIILAGLVGLFLSALPIFAPGEFLSGVPQGFLASSIRVLTARLGYDTHAVALRVTEVPYTAVELPIVVVAGVVALWGLIFLFVADRRIRTMDVVE